MLPVLPQPGGKACRNGARSAAPAWTVLQSDGYSAYAHDAKKSGVAHAQCRAHARRKILDARDIEPSQAEQTLDAFAALYKVRQQNPRRWPDGTCQAGKATRTLETGHRALLRVDRRPVRQAGIFAGQDGTVDKLFTRFESQVAHERLDFLFGAAAETATLEGTLKGLPGYSEAGANVTVIDLSGVPFEVPSMTVSLISSVAHFGINFLQFGMHISGYWCYIGIQILYRKHRNCRVNRFRHHRAGTE
ncbi:IS66 family transposase [Massilia scottii]|uniref:IS66 family transposase n=1 Tax=Massilia scottii TaxID=3057166 RepID=UPI0035B630A4